MAHNRSSRIRVKRNLNDGQRSLGSTWRSYYETFAVMDSDTPLLAIRGFGFGGSQRLFLITVISQCHKGFRCQSVLDGIVQIPVVSHSQPMNKG
jgi:hypothetical protein